jgi:hypothetical protein
MRNMLGIIASIAAERHMIIAGCCCEIYFLAFPNLSSSISEQNGVQGEEYIWLHQ